MLHPVLGDLSDAAVAAGLTSFRELGVAGARARAAAMAPPPAGPDPAVEVRDVVVDGVPVREYRPTAAEPAVDVVYAHSGGWVLGGAEVPDALLRRLSVRSGARYLSVDYRLAPEYPHPAPLDDVEAVLRSLSRRAVLHGDSAGGNLCAVLAQRHRHLVRGQVLVYPVTDWDPTRASFTEQMPPGFLDPADMAWFWDLYCPDPVARAGPACAPLRWVDAGPAPALVVTAEHDPLRDEGIAYVAALRAAGGDVEHRHVVDCTHGFVTLVGRLDRADETADAIADWVRALGESRSGT